MLCDPNILACRDWKELLKQLIDSKARININQGLDIRLMTEEKAEMIGKLRVESVHFAWDKYQDKETILPKFRQFKEITGWGARKTSVYVLTNFDTTFEQDLERIYTLRDLGYDPYVMIYDKEHTKGNDPVRLLQRYVNNRRIFRTISRFEDYDPKKRIIKEWTTKKRNQKTKRNLRGSWMITNVTARCRFTTSPNGFPIA